MRPRRKNSSLVSTAMAGAWVKVNTQMSSRAQSSGVEGPHEQPCVRRGLGGRWASIGITILLGLFLATASAEDAPTPERVDVFVSGENGYHSYRIPALITAPNGDLLVFCEARKINRSDDGDIDLLQKRSRDLGKTWLPQELIYEEGGEAEIKYGNPTPVVDRETGVIWLAVNRDHLLENGARAGGTLVLFKSDDSGASWSEPIEITNSIKEPDWGHYAFGPGIGIQIQHGEHAGRLVLPANFRRSFNKREPSWSHVIISDDHGKTWKLGGVCGDFTNECQVAEIIEDGKPGLLINMRNHWGRGGFPEKSGNRLAARSFDGGETWSAEAMDPALPEPPCQASLYRVSFEPSVLLFANPGGSGRSNLKVRLSDDEGRTWSASKVLETGSAAYSCMTNLPDGRCGIVYERNNYGQISFAAFSIDWLKN
jgi:sialidase-1